MDIGRSTTGPGARPIDRTVPSVGDRTEVDKLREESASTEQRQRLPAAARRTQLLDVALDRFAANGYHGTSMEEIADSAGVTKPVLYQHFGSKRTLYLELLETVGQELMHRVADRVAVESDPQHQVLAGFRAYFQFVCEHTSAFRLLFGGGSRQGDDFADAIRRLEGDVAAEIAGFIEADIDDDHRALLGYAIVGLAEVTGRLWINRYAEVDHPPLDPGEGEMLARRLTDLVWAGLRGLPGSTQR
jgi:AcrR family transcriptional regulator